MFIGQSVTYMFTVKVCVLLTEIARYIRLLSM